MRLRPTSARSGFTLLEVLLASAIAVGLLSGLYFAMDVILQQMDAGRQVVEQSSLSRAVFARIGNDLTSSLAPIQPASSSPSSASGATGAATTGQATSDQSTLSSAAAAGQLIFQIGVKGESSYVAIFQTRMSRNIVRPPDDGSGNPTATSADIRRICYFMTPNGLARQEILMVTSDQVDQIPSEVDEFTRILASEVKEFSVSYYDGTSWTQSWDGSAAGPDGKTPLGPPRSIELTIGLQLPGSDAVKTFKHVVTFPAAPGAASTSQSSTP